MSKSSKQNIDSMHKLPPLDLSNCLLRSEILNRQAHLSAKQSAKSRRNLPLSARIFSQIRISEMGDFTWATSSPSPSPKMHRKSRTPLSTRLPPKMTELSSPQSPPLRVSTHRSHANLLDMRRSSLRNFSKQNHDVILSLLDCRRMEELRDAFMQKNHELEFEEFVAVVWKFMNVREGQEAVAMFALLQLFEDIDINDDKKMQWSEFSDFLSASQRHSRDSEEDLEKYEMDNFKKPFSLRSGTVIQQLQYSKAHDVIAILMVNSKQVTILNHQKSSIVNVVKGHRNYIISCVFLDGFNALTIAKKDSIDKHKKRHIILATSGLDEMIIIWLITSTKKPTRLCNISVNCVHNILHWNHKRKLFVSGDMSHNLYIWDHKLQRIIWQNKHHSDVIVDILLPHKTSLLLSASMDATVVAFDLNAGRVKFKLNIHKRGLIAMAYKSELHSIVTAAAEHKLRVSDGIVGRPLAVLQGHAAPVISMISIPNSPAVVSLDSSNTLKLWDIRKMECIQSMQFGYPLHQITSMVSLLPNHPKIALGSGGMHYLTRRQPEVESSNGNFSTVCINWETESICGIFILQSKTQILTVHETQIKKWDLVNGQMVKLIRLLPDTLSKSHTIISCTVSSTKKLLLVGSSNGLVAIISIYSGGLVMTCQPKHSHPVVFVGFFDTMIVSLDSNGSLFKYEGLKHWMQTNSLSHDALSRSKLVDLSTKIQGTMLCEYTVARIHPSFGILIAGTESGLLRFIGLTNDKVILDVNSLSDGVTSIIINEEDCRLFTTDKSGNICGWQIPKQYPARKPFFCKCLFRIRNCDDLDNTITTFCVRTVGKYIITGDAKGLLKLWCVEKTHAQNDVSRVFDLTEPAGQCEYEYKWIKTIHAAADWINHIVIVTDKRLSIFDDEEDEDEDHILCIISASLDGKICAWNMDGECIGELIYLQKSKLKWNVHVDMDKKRTKQLQYACKLFKKMKL
eukprot:48750_1